MACLHRLLQVQDELSKALEKYQDNTALVALDETIEMLQVKVVKTDDFEIVENCLIEAEKTNVCFGILLHTLGYQEHKAEEISI